MQIKTNTYKKAANSGFTLVEISIVLVIIALLVTGVMVGQRLVNNSKLQNVIKEIREYDTAINQFKEKFKYYPGDLPNAENYWGAYAAGPPITGTTDGDGDWQIENTTEDFQVWRQLTLAGFTSGEYTGAISGTRMTPGINAPASVVVGGGYYASYHSTTVYGVVGNYFAFGSLQGDSGGYINGQILNARDSLYLDTKIDDGFAATGNLYAVRSAAYALLSNCVSANYTVSTATYLLNDDTVSCRLFWWLDNDK